METPIVPFEQSAACSSAKPTAAHGDGDRRLYYVHLFVFGVSLLHVTIGIQRFDDAQLIAAAPTLAEVLLRLLLSPGLTVDSFGALTRASQAEA